MVWHNKTWQKNLVPVPKNATIFSLVDKWPFGFTRNLKVLRSYINVLVGYKNYIQEWFDCIRKVKTLRLVTLPQNVANFGMIYDYLV